MPGLAEALSRPDEGRVLRPENLSNGVPPDALRVEGSAAWRIQERGPPLVLGVESPKGRSSTVTLVLEDVPVFGFHVEANDAIVRFVVEGRERARFAGEGAHDVALPPGRHTVAWTFQATGAEASASLVLDGAVAVRPPEALPLSPDLFSCLSWLDVTLLYALPLASGSVNATWNGEAVAVTILDTAHANGRVATRLRIDLGEPQPGNHTLGVEALGHEVVDTVVELLDILLGTLVYPPPGWVYDRTPDISLVLPSCARLAEVRLTVDGEEVEPRVGITHAWWSFGRELEFNEEHSFRLDVTLVTGHAFTVERTFREGLDVVEFDVKGGRVLHARQAGAATLSLPAHPPSTGVTGTVAGDAFVFLPLRERAHLRAEYAPLELRCHEAGEHRLCSPYGGGAPGYWEREGYLAGLDVGTRHGGVRSIPVAGQLAAASHFSRLALTDVELPEVLVDAGVRAALVDAVEAATRTTAGV